MYSVESSKGGKINVFAMICHNNEAIFKAQQSIFTFLIRTN